MADDDQHQRPTARPTQDVAHASTAVPTTPQGARAAGRPPAKPQTEDLTGTVVGDRYRVIEKLGEGGMGVVYVGEHIKLEKRFALKVLSGQIARRDELVQRFAQEAKAATRIGHENIIDVTDFGETPSGAPFIAMELLVGRDLARVVRGGEPLEVARIVAIIRQVCRGVGAAHAKQIYHRDLKPENIFLVEREGRRDFVKILDFGIAKVSQPAEGARLTRTGSIFGTAEYMSPEQAMGQVTDHRSDIYAVGCILYEMLTGDVPFRGESFMATLQKQMGERPVPPSQRAPERVTPALEAVVLKALAKRREARFQSLAELGDALAAAAKPGAKPLTLEPPPAPEPPAPRRAWPLVGGAALVVVAMVVAAGAWWRASTRRSNISKSDIVISNITTPNIAAPTISTPNTATPNTAIPEHAVAATAQSRIALASRPSGADVKDASGAHLGRTPLELRYAPSTPPFDVTVERHGYARRTLHVAPDRDRDYVLELPALKPAHATPEAPPSKPPAPPTPAPTRPDGLKPVE